MYQYTDFDRQFVRSLLPGAEILKLIVSLGISSALLAWARRAELSCDRAALLVMQDPHVIGRTMMKLAGGTFASSMGVICQPFDSLTLIACASLKLSMPQNSGNQRSFSGPASAA